MLEARWFWRTAVKTRHLFLPVKNPMAIYLVLPQRTFTPRLSSRKSPATYAGQPSGIVTVPACRGAQLPMGTTLRQGGKSLGRSGRRQGDLAVLYHIFLMLCINVNLCSTGRQLQDRVWGWNSHSNMCYLADFQLNLHQLVKPWDYGNLVHILDNGSYLSS